MRPFLTTCRVVVLYRLDAAIRCVLAAVPVHFALATACLVLPSQQAARAAEPPLRVRLSVTSPLPYANTPLDPTIDFPELIRQAGVAGVLDPNSIEVWNPAEGAPVPCAISEDFAYSDAGRVEFVVRDPDHREFEIRFRTAGQRPPLRPRETTPLIGVGDLLRYNAGQLRPITVPYSPGLHDLDGDGVPDLTGAWNYAHRPGWPWDGVVCYPGTGDGGGFPLAFGDLVRLRYLPAEDGAAPQFFRHTYLAVDFADFNRDGHVDLVITRKGTQSAEILLRSGRREPSGLPLFTPSATIRIRGWEACRAVDLDGDGAVDLVVDGEYIRNEAPDGWPFQAAQPTMLDAGRHPCFLDVDQDGRLDAVCLQGGNTVQPDFYRVAWRRNRGGMPLAFDPEEHLDDIDVPHISTVATWRHNGRQGLIVQHGVFQELSFFARVPRDQQAAVPHRPGLTSGPEVDSGARPRRFERIGRAESLSAVVSLSDQAWPHLCDWDDDGDLDLLVGGGYGWPRIVINEGSRERPALREPELIREGDRPVRLLRNELLGPPENWHNMGYPMPVFADWDSDGLKDLVCPNETNRIYWFRNVGTRARPVFGPRQQIECDGFADSPELRRLSATRANDPQSNNGVYPYEKESPFMWRTGAAVADFNGDGWMDLVTHDGNERVATLFTQYRDADQQLRLRKDQQLRLVDGRRINDAIVQRRAHWTESFRAVDWNDDGLLDLIYSVAGAHSGTLDGGSIYLLRNVGSRTHPLFALPETMCCFGQPIRITNHGPHPWAGDFDGDGKPDLIACVEWSVYPYYCHAALMMKERPQVKWELVQ